MLFITDAGCVICTSSLYRIIYFITVHCMKQREILLIIQTVFKYTHRTVIYDNSTSMRLCLSKL